MHLSSPTMPRLQRRNSLPPLLANTPQQDSSWNHPENNGDFFVKQRLPSIGREHSSDFSGRLSKRCVTELDFRIIDCGLEEAGGVGPPRFKEDIVCLSVDETERLRQLDLCGDGRFDIKNRTPSRVSRNRKPTTPLKLPEDGVMLKMSGTKAEYQPRPVVYEPLSSSRTVFPNRRKTQPTNILRKPPRDDIMVSMEERLERRAREKKNSSSGKGKNRKSKRAKTAGCKGKSRKNLCLLTCIKPRNIDSEKLKFMKSGYSYNPQFKYDYPASEGVLKRYSRPSSQYIPQALAIMRRVLEKYGNYEKFEWATGGQLLSKTQLWNTVKKYLEKEGFYGDVVVNISNDLIARAAMMVTGGRPTLNIRESAAKRLWVEGLLRHEIGTHHLRFHNNRQQVWHNIKVRRQMGLKPANPTEEGLASLHSVLLRKDPLLWRSAILYYTVYKASLMSFAELFEDLGQFVEDPEVRWDYCLRCKRGLTDTSKAGCFSKDQVYLTGILQLLQVRRNLDFHLLCTMGKVSHEDIDLLKPHHNQENTKIPSFMQDIDSYRSKLEYIVDVNGLEEWLSSTKVEDESKGS